MPPPENASPIAVYTQRLEACRAEAARRRRQHLRFGYVRLAWAALFAWLLWAVLAQHTAAWEWLLLPWAGFFVTARLHGRVIAAGARSRRAITWYEEGLARIEDRWSGLRPRSTRVDAAGSLYARDLDLFSAGGVFELLCTARTTLGEDTLAAWLLSSAPPAEIEARQTACADLRARTALREAVWSAPGPDLLALDQRALERWAATPVAALPAALRWLAPVLAVLTLAAALRWALSGSPLLLLPLLVVNGSLTFIFRRRLQPLFAGAEHAAEPLTAVADLLGLFEQEQFTAPELSLLQGPLHSKAHPVSRAIHTLGQLTRAAALRGNILFKFLDIPLLYTVQVGLFLQAWHGRHAAELPTWLRTVGELEALLSLSAYSYEHPEDVFPDLGFKGTARDSVSFAAESLGHPLLPATACVRNSVTLDGQHRMLLISGSNMSGKSTLLRSVGVAAVLAQAGAPVRAKHLRMTPCHVGASIQVNDSLQAGQSRFYAEILRLRAVCEQARTQPPVLFLLDELLAGTNSHDRVAGATGVVKALLASGAFGLLSTHDLALTALPELEASQTQNAHFEDSVFEGALQFDYSLREGVVSRSNGLALMRMIGLDV